jgi:flagellin
LEGISLSSNFATQAANDDAADAAGAADATVDQKALDALQKFDVTTLKFVTTGASANDISTATFEIDGHSFLLVDSNFTEDEIKALDSDVTAIQLAGTSISATADAALISAQITKVTGLMTRVATTDDAAGGLTGITANSDILFTKDKLKTSGSELTLQIGDTADSYNQMGVKIDDMHTSSLGIGDIDISNQDDAATAIDKIKAAINSVSSTRGTLGATQNRLEHTANNLSVMTENIQDAESTIRDTDIAEEMMSYTKNNILVQSAQAMLAQANSVPQGVLQLLQ